MLAVVIVQLMAKMAQKSTIGAHCFPPAPGLTPCGRMTASASGVTWGRLYVI